MTREKKEEKRKRKRSEFEREKEREKHIYRFTSNSTQSAVRDWSFLTSLPSVRDAIDNTPLSLDVSPLRR